jgi:hypothetical protein
MPDDSEQELSYHIPGDTVTTASATTVTMTLGAAFWKNPTPAVQRPAPDNPIYSYIGQVASDWAHVEHTLDLLIWDLTGTEPDAGACITAQTMGAYSRCKAIIALLTLRQRATGKTLTNLINKATELSQKANVPGDKRNRIVHDPWYVYTGSEKTGQFKAMAHKDHRYGVHPVDQKELEDTIEEIRKFSERVIAFREDVLAALASLR